MTVGPEREPLKGYRSLEKKDGGILEQSGRNEGIEIQGCIVESWK